VVKRRKIDVAALFDPNGPYRYLNGVNVPAFLAVAAGVALYYSLPHSWLKIAWGIGVAAVAYLVFRRLLAYALAPTLASSQRSSSPS
jgi:cytosine/uracil/thiamine/allantoin permease